LASIQNFNDFTDVARSYWQITSKCPVKAKICSQYMNLVKISHKQYSCIKVNCKSSLDFYIFDTELLFTNWTEMTLCLKGSSVLCFELEVLFSEVAYEVIIYFF